MFEDDAIRLLDSRGRFPSVVPPSVLTVIAKQVVLPLRTLFGARRDPAAAMGTLVLA
jgi:hypothetical protein